MVDWLPTLAALTGQIWPHPTDGIDLLPALLEGDPLPERDLYWTWRPRTNRWALRRGRWKIVHYGKEAPDEPSDWALHDLESDPAEELDLAAARPEVLTALHARFLVQRSLDADAVLTFPPISAQRPHHEAPPPPLPGGAPRRHRPLSPPLPNRTPCGCWSGTSGTAATTWTRDEKIRDLIVATDADVVLLQESYDIDGDRPTTGRWLAEGSAGPRTRAPAPTCASSPGSRSPRPSTTTTGTGSVPG